MGRKARKETDIHTLDHHREGKLSRIADPIRILEEWVVDSRTYEAHYGVSKQVMR
jgi:hypothetical protein